MRTLENNPRLEYLLKQYIKINYEANADFSEESLLREYNWLIRQNQLEALFEVEKLLTIWNNDKLEDEIRTTCLQNLRSDRRNLSYIP
tara:strand:- start:6724 stop:6987 length:264 start_codon:yes stop_codon:yes gene_type:complete